MTAERSRALGCWNLSEHAAVRLALSLGSCACVQTHRHHTDTRTHAEFPTPAKKTKRGGKQVPPGSPVASSPHPLCERP